MDWLVLERDGSPVGERLLSFIRSFREGTLETLRERLRRKPARVAGGVRGTRVPRSPIAAAWSARLAVKAGIRLDDFLRHRLAVYATKLAVPLEQLPAQIEVESGEPVLKRRGLVRSAASVALNNGSVPRWLRALAEREGPNVAGILRDIDARTASLETRIAAGRERSESLLRAFEADVTTGRIVTPAQVDATPEQMGRPTVPPPIATQGAYAVTLALLTSEVWRFASPSLPVGADALHSLGASPLESAGTLLVSLGAAIAVVALAAAALRRTEEALRTAPSAAKSALSAFVATSFACLLAVATLLPAEWKGLLIGVAVPFAAAVSFEIGQRFARERENALASQLAWDRERAVEATTCARRMEALSRAHAELRALEAEREVVRRRRAVLERRALAAEQVANEMEKDGALRLVRLTEALAAALELDRYAFLRLNAEELRALSPVRAPARLESPLAGPVGMAS